MAHPNIIVVGGGLAGLAATIKIAEMGGHVDLFSIVPVKRSHSVCAQGGINAAKNLKGEGDSTWIHFDDTVYGGDFLANQPPVKAMCDSAPGVIDLLDRMGVPFNRTPEGLLDFRRFGGTLYNRTAFAGATTGQQLLYALDEQVRRYEAEGKVTKYEAWEFLSAVIDENRVCHGICALDLRGMGVHTFPAEAVIMATGGNGAIFGKSTNSVVCTGSAQSALYQQGAFYANGEFIQVHPTCIPGEDKLRLMSESARGEGGRVWVPKQPGDKRDPKSIPEGERWYFLEEWYPKYGNLVPRDIATRAIHKVVYEHNLGIDGQPMVYLDLTHIDRKTLDRKLEGILEIYEKFVGVDPRDVPMKIFPGMHYTMGGMWIDCKQATNITGIYAAGECEFQYHGANRLGASALMQGLADGYFVIPYTLGHFLAQVKPGGVDETHLECAAARHEVEERTKKFLSMKGKKTVDEFHRELGKVVWDECGMGRNAQGLDQALKRIPEIREEFWQNVRVPGSGNDLNQELEKAGRVADFLELGELLVRDARVREESCGAHFREEYQTAEGEALRDDQNYCHVAVWEYTGENREPALNKEPLAFENVHLQQRNYK